jgi:UDPglucose 6-dehydrogenase/GDP-mannose 6-dehydrogenase
MIKYASNTLLATLISFSNEIAALSAKLEGVDAAEVMRGVHASRYLTSESTTAKLASFLFPGVGYGGSCLPKDTVALASLGRELGVPMPLLEQVDITNREQPHRAAAAAIREFGGVSGSCVGVLGLAFKPGTDDIRESPAFPIIGDLLAAGSSVIAHDPLAIPAAESWLGAKPGLEFEQELDLLIDKVDAIILVTGWELYLEVPKLIAEQARPIPLFDGRRFLERSSLPNYSGVGLK